MASSLRPLCSLQAQDWSSLVGLLQVTSTLPPDRIDLSSSLLGWALPTRQAATHVPSQGLPGCKPATHMGISTSHSQVPHLAAGGC